MGDYKPPRGNHRAKPEKIKQSKVKQDSSGRPE